MVFAKKKEMSVKARALSIFLLAAIFSSLIVMGSTPKYISREASADLDNPTYSWCGDQDPRDLTDSGIPPESTRTDTPYPLDDFEYDEINFDIFERDMHNRKVTVAVEKDYDFEIMSKEEFAEYIFNTWGVFWKEYGGFPYPSFTVVIGHNVTGTGGHGVGFQAPDDSGPENASNSVNYHKAHEMYHSWNGSAIGQEGHRQWFVEGATTYYGNRMAVTDEGHLGNNHEAYLDWMEVYYQGYLNYYDSGQDRPIADITMDAPGYDSSFVGQKGSIVAYLLDKELKKTGHHLGEVTRFLYQTYGVETSPDLTNEQILFAFNEVSGQDFTDFFEKYIYGTEKLPLEEDDSIEWICHGPALLASPSSHDFGTADVGSQSGAQTFNISSNGTEDLAIGSLLVTGSNASEFIILNDNCSEQTLAPSSSCTVDVIFSPTSEGNKRAYLTESLSGQEVSILNLLLTGNTDNTQSEPDGGGNGGCFIATTL